MLQSQRSSFQQLLTTVWNRSEFYRDYYSSHGIREADLPELTVEHLPFTSKRLLMDNFDRVVTDERLKLDELEGWLDSVRDPRQLFKNDFIVMHGSGASGITGIFAYSRTDWQIMNGIMADRLPRPENHAHGKTRVAFYRVMHGHFAGVATAVHLPLAVYEPLIVSLLEPVERVIEQLNRFQPHRLTGYSSSIAFLADRALEGKLRIAPQRIFVSGDLLSPVMEERIDRAWGSPVCNLYGASESLFLAIKDADGPMRIMSDLNIFEILDEKNQPVKPGDQGKVVITNLCNRTVPIVRYELGDYVTRGNGEGETIQSIRPGKAHEIMPIVLDDGRLDELTPAAFTSFYALGVQKAQFIREHPKRIRIDYIARVDVDDRVRNEFQRILALKGASGMAVDVRRVPWIHADPKTGKVRLVVLRENSQQLTEVNSASPQQPTAGSSRPFCQNFERFRKLDIEQSIARRFEQQVEKYPERRAVQSGNSSLTYEELNREANRIAHAVLASGTKEEDPVPFLLDPGTPPIAAILGILKAGRFFLALDPSYPAKWLSPILQNGGSSAIVTNSIHARLALALGGNSQPIINIDELDPNLPAINPQLEISPDCFAYLYHTSGSSGPPKGVAQSHRHALHQVMTYTNWLELGAADRCTCLHSHGFSASRLDILAPLLNGATALPFSVAAQGIHRLASWLREQGITVFHWVPSAFRHFLDTVRDNETFPSVRAIVLGSEPLTLRDVELYRKHFSSNCMLINRFGTTETGNICLYSIGKSTQLPAASIPVGFALEDLEVLILDEAGQPMTCGEVGEIAVRSPYLSGYWRTSEPSRSGFVADGTPPGKMYRSGDLGYTQPDGCLVHLGRNDLQVKVRGQRVELSRIEQALLEHPDVHEATVVARRDTAGEPRLIAYIVPQAQANLTGGALRSFLETRLPGYMIPAIFTRLDALPVTPSGKIDRGGLPEPEHGKLPETTHYAEPRNELEEGIAQVWREILQVPRLGIHDQFLDVGGHSLLAGKIIASIAEVLEIELSYREFFEHPTIAELAELLSRKLARSAAGGLTPADGEIGSFVDKKNRT